MLAFLDWLTFDGLLKLLHDAFVAAWDFIRSHLVEILGPAWLCIKECISSIATFLTHADTAAGVVAPYLRFANGWVPVDLFVQMVTAYCTFWACLVTYRAVKSWIPTLSGS